MITGKSENKDLLKQEIKELVNIVDSIDQMPDVIITLGGDGSFLFNEQRYPEIPKLILKDNSLCFKCHEGQHKQIIIKLSKGKYIIQQHKKIEATIVKKDSKNMALIGSNDIIIRNSEQFHAIRFSTKINNQSIAEQIGDGIVVSTAFGSTGYFKAITGKSFDSGIGIAFNNVSSQLSPKIESNAEEFKVEFELLRNKAYLSVDNSPDMILLEAGDKIIIKQSDSVFNLVKVD